MLPCIGNLYSLRIRFFGFGSRKCLSAVANLFLGSLGLPERTISFIIPVLKLGCMLDGGISRYVHILFSPLKRSKMDVKVFQFSEISLSFFWPLIKRYPNTEIPLSKIYTVLLNIFSFPSGETNHHYYHRCEDALGHPSTYFLSMLSHHFSISARLFQAQQHHFCHSILRTRNNDPPLIR